MKVPNFFWVIVSLLAFVFVMLGFIALRGNEDTWLCQEGQWVRHGQPSTSKPMDPCL